MRTKETQRILKTYPVTYFQDHPELLWDGITQGLEIFFKNFSDTQLCCNFFGNNAKPHHSIASQILLLLQCDLGIDLLVNSKQYFNESYQYLPYIWASLNDIALKNDIIFDPPLVLSNINNLMWKIGNSLENKTDVIEDEAQFNKIIKILNRYKIVFFPDNLDRNSITTPPMRGFIAENIGIRHLSAILEVILKKTVTESFVIYTNDQAGTITISRPAINFLSEFQKKILKHSKSMIQKYFADKTIKIVKDTTVISEQDHSEKDSLKQASENQQIYSTNIEFKALKSQIETDLGHYHLTIKYIQTEFDNYFEFVHTKQSESITKFFENLYNEDEDVIFTFTSIDTIVAIVQPFLNEKNLNKLETIKFGTAIPVPQELTSDEDSKEDSRRDSPPSFLATGLPKTQQGRRKSIDSPSRARQPVTDSDIQPEQFILRIPLEESTKHLCFGRIKMVLSSLSINLTVTESESFLELTSCYPVVLLMIEVKLKGLKDAFTHLLTNHGAIEAYAGSHTHLIEQKSPQTLAIWKGPTYKTETSTHRYLKLSKPISRDNGLSDLYEIQKILGDDFEVGLLDDGELIRLNDIPKSLTHNAPRPSFYNQYNQTDKKVSDILKKIQYKTEISVEDLKYLNKKRPPLSKRPQILIRGLKDHSTCLLEYFYTYVKLIDTGLPDSIKNIVFEYLGDELSSKTFQSLSMR